MNKKNVVVEQEQKIIEAKCQNCGKKVMLQTPYKGDILCGKCLEPSSWTLKTSSK